MGKLIDKKDKFYIAGQNGMAGSAICRALIKNKYRNIISVRRDDLDLCNYESVIKWFHNNKPEVVDLSRFSEK